MLSRVWSAEGPSLTFGAREGKQIPFALGRFVVQRVMAFSAARGWWSAPTLWAGAGCGPSANERASRASHERCRARVASGHVNKLGPTPEKPPLGERGYPRRDPRQARCHRGYSNSGTMTRVTPAACAPPNPLVMHARDDRSRTRSIQTSAPARGPPGSHDAGRPNPSCACRDLENRVRLQDGGRAVTVRTSVVCMGQGLVRCALWDQWLQAL